MKSTIIFILFFVAHFAWCIELSANDVDKHWNLFKRKYNKNYSTDQELHRRSIFEKSLVEIINHNIAADLGRYTWRKGVTKFVDLTKEEFNAQYTSYKNRSKQSDGTYYNSTGANPNYVDWRRKGIVTRVKDQRQCGSDWAFSAVASIEGQIAKKTGKLVSLSEQNLVDCSTRDGNYGCRGGWMDKAFDYIRRNKGIDTERSYPYRGIDDACRYDPNNVGATLKGYVYIRQYSENDLEDATAAIGPISVAVDARDFQYYQYGILYSQYCSSTDLDHAVTVVGYGTEDGYDYWIVKNSWGADWGENGYIRMSRNQNNQCGIATAALYPVV